MSMLKTLREPRKIAEFPIFSSRKIFESGVVYISLLTSNIALLGKLNKIS